MSCACHSRGGGNPSLDPGLRRDDKNTYEKNLPHDHIFSARFDIYFLLE